MMLRIPSSSLVVWRKRCRLCELSCCLVFQRSVNHLNHLRLHHHRLKPVSENFTTQNSDVKMLFAATYAPSLHILIENHSVNYVLLLDAFKWISKGWEIEKKKWMKQAKQERRCENVIMKGKHDRRKLNNQGAVCGAELTNYIQQKVENFTYCVHIYKLFWRNKQLATFTLSTFIRSRKIC